MKYAEIDYRGRRAILAKQDRPYNVKSPNFKGTGMALVCFLRPGEDIKHYLIRKERRLKEIFQSVAIDVVKYKNTGARKKVKPINQGK